MASGRRFVVQEHHASHLHWDFRLEHQGVLVSWAVPKGLPVAPEEKRLAVQTEDHPLSYAAFEGQIPEGHYGAGRVILWDHGLYECHKFQDDEVQVTLLGQRVAGRYVLFRTNGKRWIMRRLEHAPAGWTPAPKVSPMQAVLGTLPLDPEAYAFEVKWDGFRALATIEGGRLSLQSRTGRNIATEYPELQALGGALGSRSAVLDGELVVLGADGRSDFQRLQQRRVKEGGVPDRSRLVSAPVTYILFDLLYLDGRDLRLHSYEERRQALAKLRLDGPHWKTPASHRGNGAELLAAARAARLEGIMAKRLAAPYRSGARSRDWIKIKLHGRQELVIGGWTTGKDHPLGALLLGYFEGEGLCYAGRVGTGFSTETRTLLHGLLEARARPTSPFQGPVREAGKAHFARPELVAEVEFSEWTQRGTLRHPVFKGLRDDKAAQDVVRERPVEG